MLPLLASAVLAFQGQPFSPVGSWSLDKDVTTRLELDARGGFRFSSPSFKSTSSGTYEVSGNQIVLRYTEVDGERAFPGMKMTIQYDSTVSGIRVNKFLYVRQKS